MSNPSVCLLILDGWGMSSESHGNAIKQARTPHFDALWEAYPHTLLQAHGEAVGMPLGVVGNSEVGHLTMGAGRAVPHPRLAIDHLIETDTLKTHPLWTKICQHLQQSRGTLHLISLLSTGGVHSDLSHLAEFLGLAHDAGLAGRLRVHGITDGRDIPPYTAMGMVEDVEGALYDLDAPQMATLSGRFYAMDRDQHWTRTEAAFNAMMHGKGKRQFLATQAVKFALAEDLSDEFILPTVTDLSYEGMETGDVVLFLNFRPDRMKQIVSAFASPDFDAFDRGTRPSHLYCASLVDYGDFPQVEAFIPRICLKDTLAQRISEAGLSQFHVAETEKYPHVTYFFNGGDETPLPGETRTIIPSRRDVLTHNQAPAMRAFEISHALIEALDSKAFSFLVANLANVDMVGHTGDENATIEAVEQVDQALGLIYQACQVIGTSLIITADHGNGESMRTPDGSPHTAHTIHPVPFIWVPAPGINPETIDLSHTKGLADIRALIEQALQVPTRLLPA